MILSLLTDTTTTKQIDNNTLINSIEFPYSLFSLCLLRVFYLSLSVVVVVVLSMSILSNLFNGFTAITTTSTIALTNSRDTVLTSFF